MGALMGCKGNGLNTFSQQVNVNFFIYLCVRLKLLIILVVNAMLLKAQSGLSVLEKVHTHRNQSFDQLFIGLSGSVYPITFLTPVSCLAWGYYHPDKEWLNKGIVSGIGIALAGTGALALKYGIKRERPYVQHSQINPLVQTGPFSMPSGHATASFATATSITLMIPKWYVALPAYVWAGGVAYSRMHLGVHYPGDILAGALLGSACSAASFYINKKLRTQLK